MGRWVYRVAPHDAAESVSVVRVNTWRWQHVLKRLAAIAVQLPCRLIDARVPQAGGVPADADAGHVVHCLGLHYGLPGEGRPRS
jgi:hypothetical protein